MWIDELVVAPGREEHIARHGVTVREVEDVVFRRSYMTRTGQGRYRVVGQTTDGRYLTVIVAPRGSGEYALVTARDADSVERRQYLARRRR